MESQKSEKMKKREGCKTKLVANCRLWIDVVPAQKEYTLISSNEGNGQGDKEGERVDDEL